MEQTMTKDATPTAERSWVERNLAALMVGIFGTGISALMVIMVGSINDLRTDLTTIDTSLTSLQTEMVSTRVTIAEEVALVDDEIVRSIGGLKADFAIANQHLTGIDTHLSLLKREFAQPVDISLASDNDFGVADDFQRQQQEQRDK
jgi:hypothetical protein